MDDLQRWGYGIGHAGQSVRHAGQTSRSEGVATRQPRQWRSSQTAQAVNLSSHKRAAVKAAIESVGAELRFLPPYSPDLNPIEKAFSKLKAMLRKAQKRTITSLQDYLGQALDNFSPEECRNYFASCGYNTATTSREPL